MYCETSFKTKKALREAVASGRKLRVFQPGGLSTPPVNGSVCLEGPNFQMHTWYASCKLENGIIVSVK